MVLVCDEIWIGVFQRVDANEFHIRCQLSIPMWVMFFHFWREHVRQSARLITTTRERRMPLE